MSMHYLTKRDLGKLITDEEALERAWSDGRETRRQKCVPLPLLTADGDHFVYNHISVIDYFIERIDQNAQAGFGDPQWRHGFDAFTEETFYSSKIEGAFSSVQRAKAVIQHGVVKNDSERMILNHYLALQYALANLEKPIDNDGLVQVQQILTDQLLRPEDISDGYWRGDVPGMDGQNNPVFSPPRHDQIPSMMDSLFEFISTSTFHPLVTASILHFYLAYVHPFRDGNGPSARVGMYWYLLQHKCEFVRYLSVSQRYDLDLKAYYQAFVDSQEEEKDLTHFVVMNVEAIYKAVKSAILNAPRGRVQDKVRERVQQQDASLSRAQIRFLKYVFDSNGARLTAQNEDLWPSREIAVKEVNELVSWGFIERSENGEYHVRDVE